MLGNVMFLPELEMVLCLMVLLPFPHRFRIQDADNAAGVGGDGDRIGGERVGCPFEISKSGQSENMIYYLRSRELRATVARG